MKNPNSYYTKNQLDKIGNTVIYLSDNCKVDLYKTNLLKLIYILEEASIKKYGIPFFNIDFKIWRLGPVQTDLYYELTEGLEDFSEYFMIKKNDRGVFVEPISDFNDDEFSDNDIELMDLILKTYSHKNSTDLIDITHQIDKPWYIQAKELDLLNENGDLKAKITDESIDFERCLDNESIQFQLYHRAKESQNVFDSFIHL